MVIKGVEIVEITPDPWETKKKSSKTKKSKILTKEEEEEEEEDGTPIRGIFCLKTRQDMTIFEDKEDCFILDFDPNDTFDSRRHSISNNLDGDNDIAIIHEKGQVACRDYPHPRHLCSKFPFASTRHASHCNQCFCYVCDSAAPCAQWTSHCDAIDDTTWKRCRDISMGMAARFATTTSKV